MGSEKPANPKTAADLEFPNSILDFPTSLLDIPSDLDRLYDELNGPAKIYGDL